MTDKKAQASTHSSKDAFSNPFYDAVKNFKMPIYDQESTMQAYRKNIEAMTTAQKNLLEMMKDVTNMNAEFSRNLMEDLKDHMKTVTEANTLEEKTQLNAEKIKTNLERMMEHSRQVTDIWSKSCTSVGEKLQSRFKECMDEAQCTSTGSSSSKGKTTKH